MRNYEEHLRNIMPVGLNGSVTRSDGLVLSVGCFPAPVGALVEVQRDGNSTVRGEVVGFRGLDTLVLPYDEIRGVRHGNRVRMIRSSRFIPVGTNMIGRVIDSHGEPMDGKGPMILSERVPISQAPPNAIERPRIRKPLTTGVRPIDAMLTCGMGQRMGIFAAAGVGKSVTLGMMAKYTSADVNVIALIGERGREVNDFLERDLGDLGLKRSVVVVATGDQSALLRAQAAETATAIAEYFRDRGKNVLLIMDSLTRYAMAQREIGLAAGEPPTTKGYPPSVFAKLPRLVERAGTSAKGSITAFYSVLVEGDDVNEPVADTVRGLLDGHTILSRSIAARGHYPAIDLLASISRLMTDITPPDHQKAAQRIRELLAAYRDNEDLITIGAYRAGTNPLVDTAIQSRDSVMQFLKQRVDEGSNYEKSSKDLIALATRFANNAGAGVRSQT